MTVAEQAVRVPGGWRVLPPRGCGVTEVVVRPDSLAVHVGSSGIELVSQAELTTDAGSYWVAASPQTNLGVCVGLVRQVVIDLHVFDDGRLLVEFGGGWRLSSRRVDGSAEWSLHVLGLGTFAVRGTGALMVPASLAAWVGQAEGMTS